ncbi:hypothetical protein [Polaribacter cellanae]|uniref:TonB-dependent receptor plug domain-containing protein n=1 Tax=Polaribacter cellanae TaxID=2818493 RepID=A0A975CK79_9FLAO|nr:hypothetical protein [Polaribacter cellanae]QTE21426.1 hypothetical protein J3359_11385 [Polaribacter cellanae]
MKKILIAIFISCISIANFSAQNKLKVEVKAEKKPDVYIDGVKYNYTIVNLLDQTKIESIDIIKDEKALKEYKAPNGVILIKTKKNSKPNLSIDEKKPSSKKEDKEPLVIINGKVANKAALSNISTQNIASVKVLKGKEAIKQYKSPNGVIIIKTKN